MAFIHQAEQAVKAVIEVVAVLSLGCGERHLLEVAQGLEKMGFSLVATRGTADYLRKRGVAVETVNKVTEGRPHIVDQITDMQVDFVINTVYGAQSQKDSYSIRRTTLMKGIPYFTTISAARAAVRGIAAIKKNSLQVKSIQEYHSS